MTYIEFIEKNPSAIKVGKIQIEGLQKMGKSFKDIKNNTKLFFADLKESYDALLGAKINPTDVPLEVAVNNYNHLIEIIGELKKFGYEIDSKTLRNHGFLLTLLNKEEIADIIVHLDTYGLKPLNSNGKVAVLVLLQSPQEIDNNMSLLTKYNEVELAVNYPEVLAGSVVNILNRIEYCKINNIAYKDAGKYASFLFTEVSFAKKTDIPTPVLINTEFDQEDDMQMGVAA